MEAGRELDSAIAEKVMGNVCSCGDVTKEPRMNPYGMKEFCLVHGNSFPAYSSSIESAWAVVEKLVTMNIGVDVSKMPNDELWHSALYIKDEDGDYMASCDTMFEAVTAPLAICLAALKAVGH